MPKLILLLVCHIHFIPEWMVLFTPENLGKTVWGFAFWREIEVQEPKLLLKFHRITAFEFCNSAQLTKNQLLTADH
jgi:hypothetical protein